MNTDGRVIDYQEALRAARRRFLVTARLSMGSLAEDLWVSRATLYRVVGSRDRLLGDVLWQLARRSLDLARQDAAATGMTGVDRLLHTSRLFHAEVEAFQPVQRYLRHQPEEAARILFTATGQVHARAVKAWATLFRQALASGEIETLPYGVDETAYLFVRVGESILYGDLLAGIVPAGGLSEHLRRSILAAGAP